MNMNTQLNNKGSIPGTTLAMLRNIFIACMLGILSANTYAARVIELDIGEMKILKLPAIERVAVGKADMLGTSLLENGQLLLIAEAPGKTIMHIWYSSGREEDIHIRILEADMAKLKRTQGIKQTAAEVRDLLAHVPNLEISVKSGFILLEGTVDGYYAQDIQAVSDSFKDKGILNMTKDIQGQVEQVRELLNDVEGLNVRVVSGHIVLSGEVDTDSEDMLKTVKTSYPSVMDLTRKSELNLPHNKMVLMDVNITQFSKDYVERLGIDWDRVAGGPTAAFAHDAVDNDLFRGASGFPNTLEPSLLLNDAGAVHGYFGIAAEITSRINFAVDNGYGLILSQPRLAARSGGEAHFLAGGEVPLVSSSVNGSTVEYKEFGIGLTIKPIVDKKDNIQANIDTEVTAITGAGAGGNPIFSSRKTSADIAMREGETLVLSGLIDNNLQESVSKVAWLGDIPIIGAFFRNNAKDDQRRELVIFVTPTVHNANSEKNRAYLQQQRDRVTEFYDATETEESLRILD